MKYLIAILALFVVSCGTSGEFPGTKWQSMTFVDLESGEAISEVWEFSGSTNNVLLSRHTSRGELLDSTALTYTIDKNCFRFNSSNSVCFKKLSDDTFSVSSYGGRNYSGLIQFNRTL